MENIKLRILDSKNIYGTMNTGTINLRNITPDDKIMLMYKNDLKPADLLDYDRMSFDEKTKIMVERNLRPSELVNYRFTKDDKQQIFANHRKAFAEANGFDWHKMFMADQVNKNGSYFEITNEYVEANPNGWTDIPEDILIITDKVPGVAIGHPVADCPVIIIEDIKQGVTAIAHCSAELIDKKMPMMIADALNNAYGTKDEDIHVHVGACAGSNWTYDKWPNWANDKKLWKNSLAIMEINGEFKIDSKNAIDVQLEERGIGNHKTYDFSDTIVDREYYSNSAARNNPDKQGRQFNGAIYQKTR